MTQLLAFHGKQEIKDKYTARVKAHMEADEIIHGKYWENGKGCAVGCTIHSGQHNAYETELGLPEWLARLEDGIFEGQKNRDSKTFPLRFLEAIPVGADTELVKLPLLAWLMDDPELGLAFKTSDEEIKALALEVAAKLRAGEIAGPEAAALTERLRAAWAARDARAARAAWDAAWAAWDARAAAWAAWDAWAARAARDAFVKASSEELLRLLSELKPVTTH